MPVTALPDVKTVVKEGNNVADQKDDRQQDDGYDVYNIPQVFHIELLIGVVFFRLPVHFRNLFPHFLDPHDQLSINPCQK